MRCLMCGKEKGFGSLSDVLIGKDPLCHECRSKWLHKPLHFMIDGIPAESSYIYNDAFSSCLIQYKECMDEALSDVFLHEVKHTLQKKYRGYTILPMPSSMEKQKLRGFSHLEKMFACLDMEMMDVFVRIGASSQKAQTARQRREIQHEIILKEGVRLPDHILLADDTITTGSTLRGALHALHGYHGKVRIYAVSANRSYESEQKLNVLRRKCVK